MPEVTFNEIRLYGRAMKQRWDIPQKTKREIIEMMAEVLRSSDDAKYKIGAAKVLIACESQNQQDEHKLTDIAVQREHDRLASVADELGLDPSVIEAASNEASPGTGCIEDKGSEADDYSERQGNHDAAAEAQRIGKD